MPLRDAQLAIRAIEALHNLTEGMKSGHQSFFLALVFHLPFVFPEPMFQERATDILRIESARVLLASSVNRT